MITTTHARPLFQIGPNLHPFTKAVFCPHCSKVLGLAAGVQQGREILGKHRCLQTRRDVLQPSTSLPFS